MNASTMSSETSIKASLRPNSRSDDKETVGPNASSGSDDSLQPWQLFTLAGLAGATAVVFAAKDTSPAGVVLLSLTVGASAWLGLAAWRTLMPLFGFHRSMTTDVLGGRTRASLEREKVLVLRAIKDLEFDRAMGKVAEKDFVEMSGRLRTRAVGLLRQLDRGTGYRDEIERELAKRAGGSAATKVAAYGSIPENRAVGPGFSSGKGSAATKVAAYESAPAAYESGSATTKVAAYESAPAAYESVPVGPNFSSGKACVCGTSNDIDARFCKNCGSKLEAA